MVPSTTVQGPSAPRRESRRVLVLGLCSMVVSVGALRADVLAPGQRSIDHDVLVEVGEWSRDLYWEAVVEEGETLSAIAQRTLGNAQRFPELVACNDLQDPDALRAGQVLLVPPRSLDDGRSKYHLFCLIEYPFGIAAQRVRVGRPLPFFKWDVQLCAVLDGRVTEFLEAAEPGQGRRARLTALRDREGVDWLLLSEPQSVSRSVGLLSTTKVLTTRLDLVSMTSGRLELDAKTRRAVNPTYWMLFAITVAVESLIAAGFPTRWTKVPRGRLVAVVALINGVSHPAGAFALQLGAGFAVVEASVFLLEATLLTVASGTAPVRGALVAATCNAATTSIALLWVHLG